MNRQYTLHYFIFVFAVLFATQTPVRSQNTLITDISWEYLKNYPPISEQIPNEKHLSECNEYLIAFNLLLELKNSAAKNYNPTDPYTKHIKGAWSDLKIFYDQGNPEQPLLKKLSRCTTVTGTINFAQMLALPTHNVNELVARQNITQLLMRDENLFDTLHAELQNIATHEKTFLSRCYYSTDITSSLNLIERFFTQGSTRSNINLIMQYALDLPSSAYNIPYRLHTYAQSILAYDENSSKSRSAILYCRPYKRLALFHKLGKMMCETQSLILSPFLVQNQIKLLYNLLDQQQTMINISSLLYGSKKIHRLIKQHSQLSSLIPTPHLDALFINQKTLPDNVQKFLSAIKTNTFRGKPSFFSWLGTVSYVWHLFESVKHDLLAAFNEIGNIDSYVSIASLLKEHQSAPSHYCFPTYLESDMPAIDIQESWHPALDPQTVVSSSLAMGNSAPCKNALVMGPNGGGKSTTTNGIMLAIYLGQTLGISPATHAAFTPFAKLITFAEKNDDIVNKKSKFMVEAEQIGKLCTLARASNPGEKMYLALDEIITGTGPDKASEIAYGTIEYLGSQPHTMFTLCTHYPELEALAHKDPKTYGLFTVPSTVDDAGNIHNSYQLTPGAYRNSGTQLAILKKYNVPQSIIYRAQSLLSPPSTPAT
jgi:DNA mismatch repair ATPase MutS